MKPAIHWLAALTLSGTQIQPAQRNPASTMAGSRPNIILILADDLGYGDLGCYGQKKIQTPRLDRMANEGMRFTRFYAGSTVCAPSRCVLMTGRHTGHARIRGNDRKILLPEDQTIAQALKSADYETALIGKWGLGDLPTDSVPTRKGFDSFYGYLNNLHAHNYYPDFLWRQETKESVKGNVVRDGVATAKATYSHDLLTDAALEYLRREHARPFFLYLAYTIPHANNEAGRALGDGLEVPDYGAYAQKDWPQPEKGRAAMISRLDRDVGRLLDAIDAGGQGERTIVLFTSDNGPHREGNSDPAFFQSSGPFRGIKRDLYEGGLRVPLLVRWTGRTPAGSVSDYPAGFWDVFPTFCELAGVPHSGDLDGVSMANALVDPAHPRGDFAFYWEFHERGFSQAMLTPEWKALRVGGSDAEIELYDLKHDPGETRSRSRRYPEVVERFERLFERSRSADPDYPARKRGEASAKSDRSKGKNRTKSKLER